MTHETLAPDPLAEERKRLSKNLRDIADQVDAGTVEAYGMFYRSRCDSPNCHEWHLGMLVQTMRSTAELEIWMTGAAYSLADYILRDYYQRMRQSQMAPIFEAIQNSVAQRQAEGATKQ